MALMQSAPAAYCVPVDSSIARKSKKLSSSASIVTPFHHKLADTLGLVFLSDIRICGHLQPSEGGAVTGGHGRHGRRRMHAYGQLAAKAGVEFAQHGHQHYYAQSPAVMEGEVEGCGKKARKMMKKAMAHRRLMHGGRPDTTERMEVPGSDPRLLFARMDREMDSSSSSSSESSSSSSSDSDCGGKRRGMGATMKKGKMEGKKWKKRRASMDVVSMLRSANAAVESDPAVAELAARMLSGIGRELPGVIDVPAVTSTAHQLGRSFEADLNGQVAIREASTAARVSPFNGASTAVTDRPQNLTSVEIAPVKSVASPSALRSTVYGETGILEKETRGVPGPDPRVRISESGHRVEVCMGKKCRQRGADEILAQLQSREGLGGLQVEASACAKCMKQCKYAPNVRIGMESGVVPVRDTQDVLQLLHEGGHGREGGHASAPPSYSGLN